MTTPNRILMHRPDLAGKPRAERKTGQAVKQAIPPGFARQVKTVLGATARWIAAGRPVRTPEQLAEVKNICGVCPHWNPAGWLGAGRCMKCGCAGLKREWATESCPDRPPKWLATYVDKPAEVEPSSG